MKALLLSVVMVFVSSLALACTSPNKVSAFDINASSGALVKKSSTSISPVRIVRGQSAHVVR